jgi:F0F1-type ATP synthase membrane subunit a
MVFTIMSGLIPLLLPVALLGLAILVSTIQAFIFSLLTTVYIGLSVPHHDHDHDHH